MPKLLFTVANKSRKPVYCLQTAIYTSEEGMYVEKKALYPEASQHLNHLKSNSDLSRQKITHLEHPRILKMSETSIQFEYLPAPTLEKHIEEAIINHRPEEIKAHIEHYATLLHGLPVVQKNPFEQLLFQTIFDPEKRFLIKEEKECVSTAFVDFTFDNIIFDSKKSYLIDNEWVYPFPIEKKFIYFRSIFTMSYRLQHLISGFASKDLPVVRVYGTFYIPVVFFNSIPFTKAEVERYLHYIFAFQHFVTGHHHAKEKVVFDQDETVSKRLSDDLENYISKKISQKTAHLDEIHDLIHENIDLREEVHTATLETQALHTQIHSIHSSLFYKLWRVYNKCKSLLGKS